MVPVDLAIQNVLHVMDFTRMSAIRVRRIQRLSWDTSFSTTHAWKHAQMVNTKITFQNSVNHAIPDVKRVFLILIALSA